ncbi:unannotated protein [freshwater metagenome]|uniref:Unannotated protein n=1 Tax=freshwater metagenome TaxID=449393 RepID=A0A6J7JRM1_9ZZZZ|nr:hypothetical protein [Actinomycetota bacterium]
MTTSAPPPPPKTKPPRPAWKTITVVVLVALLSIPVLSIGKAVLTPNSLSMTERAAEWMRDNNLGFILNNVESWWFSKNGPKAGGEPDREIDVTNAAATGPTTPPAVPHLAKPANVAVPEGVTPVANEGVWSPVGPLVGGAQTMYTTQVRPDSVHTSILDGLVWMDPKLVKFEVHPGTEEPGGKQTVPAQVPLDKRLDLISAFNGGFRMQDAMGGFYLDGVTYKPLRDGAASLVVYKDGVASVGMWGRDFEMGPNIEAVRQNLDLIIDNGGGFPFPGGNPSPKDKAAPGEPAEGLDNNQNGAWGDTLGNKVLVWRSAVGVTADGALVYGYGAGLGARSLADLMVRAGCVRAMELDINPAWTTFNFYNATTPGNPSSVKGTKLLPDSEKSGNRYLSNDARDFVAIFARKI